MEAVYYFGCWGHPGHYLFAPDGRAFGRNEPLPVALRQLDGQFCGDPALADLSGQRRGHPPHWPGDAQPVGLARLHHVEGWTVLAWWDRSGDPRAGSNSAFVAPGIHTAATLRKLGADAFPAVWRRIEAAGGLTLPG